MTGPFDIPMPVQRLDRSRQLSEVAQELSPRGVHGAFKYYDPFPIYVARAQGARLWDVDGNEYIDYVGSFGPSALGVANPAVVQAVVDSLREQGVIVALPHPSEVELDRALIKHIPYAEKVTFHGGGGSDAIYNAVRLARAHTGRQKLVKFEGGYHGWHDDVAISVRPSAVVAGPYEQPNAVPVSAGALPEHARNCLIAHFNDEAFLERLVTRHHADIAAIIVEPVVHASGCLRLEPTFLRLIRQLCDTYGIVLIYDEIITGFRHGLGGAAVREGVYPDLAAFGKALANGFVLSALAGRNELMSMLAPEGPVLFSGTFNGYSTGVAAALKTIEIMESEPVHDRLFRLGQRMADGINASIERHGVPAVCQAYGSVWCLYFTVRSVRTYRDIIHFADSKDYAVNVAFRNFMLERGIFLPSYFTNRAFISYAHTDEDVDRTIEATDAFIAAHAAALRGAEVRR